MKKRTITGYALTLLILAGAAAGFIAKSDRLEAMELNQWGDCLAGVAASLALVWIVVG